jgi:phosphate transport system substrate-binding protein
MLCAPVYAAQPVGIVIRGSTTLVPLSQRLAEGFMRQSSGRLVTVGGGGSALGFEALIAGEVDIANSSRFINQAEQQAANDAGVYPVPFRIADDCIIPVVHKSNPVRNLTLNQLRSIYSGKLTHWNQVGGIDRRINVLARGEESGTFRVWRDLVMRGESVSASINRLESSANVIRTVSRGRGAIGFISLGQLSAAVKPLSVDGVMGSLHSARSGSYVLSRSLYMFTRGWPSGRTLEFINYALNPQWGQHLVEQSGFVPRYQQ